MPKDSNDSLTALSALFIFMYAYVVTHQAPSCICSTPQYKLVPNHTDELSTCVCACEQVRFYTYNPHSSVN